MDFFAHQNRYRRRSAWLLLLFGLAVLGAVVVVDIVVAMLYRVVAFWLEAQQASLRGSTLVRFSVLQLVLIAAASCYRLLTLREGGSVVALGLGATPVPAGTDNPTWRRLRNVVEEIAIASGTPVFNVFVMEGEPGINAFAAGYTASDAAICVTQGGLDKLTRDELQGVIAHEFSHVVHGDMRLNLRLVGLLYGILGVGVMGHVMLQAAADAASARGRGADNSVPALMFMAGLVMVIYGSAGSFFGRLVQAAVARTRESLADASAVQYTRQTAGIAGALKKIGALREGARLRTPGRGEVAHMLFGAAGRRGGWFATHPSLHQRLRALGVVWSETEMRTIARAWQRPRYLGDTDAARASLAGFAPRDGMPDERASHMAAGPVAEVGGARLPRDRIDLAAAARDRLPAVLRAMAEDVQQADAVLAALVMDRDPALRQRQKALLGQAWGDDGVARTARAWAAVHDLDPMLRLPLAALAFPVLRRQPRPRLEALLALLDVLVRVDGQVRLDDYCLMHLLTRQLHDLLDPAAGFRPGGRRLREMHGPFATVCAIIAVHGHPHDREAARRTWLQAMQRTVPGWTGAFAVPVDWQAAMDVALDALDRLRAPDKRLVIDGLGVAVAADGIVTVAESELLRTVCAVLHCPLPRLRAQPATPA